EKRSAVPGRDEMHKDSDRGVRGPAAAALRSNGRHAQAAVPALIAALKDEAVEVRRAATAALWSIHPEKEYDPTLVPAIVGALRDPDAKVRQLAAIGLSVLVPRAEAAVPALAIALKDPDARVRLGAASALAQIGPGAKAAVPALLEALKDKNAAVRGSAAQALQKIDPKKEPPTLVTNSIGMKLALIPAGEFLMG